MIRKKQTYGGLPVDDEYLVRYELSSDEEVIASIAIGLAVVILLGLALVGGLVAWQALT